MTASGPLEVAHAASLGAVENNPTGGLWALSPAAAAKLAAALTQNVARVLKGKEASPAAKMEAADLIDRTDIDHGPIATAVAFVILLGLMLMYVLGYWLQVVRGSQADRQVGDAHLFRKCLDSVQLLQRLCGRIAPVRKRADTSKERSHGPGERDRLALPERP